MYCCTTYMHISSQARDQKLTDMGMTLIFLVHEKISWSFPQCEIQLENDTQPSFPEGLYKECWEHVSSDISMKHTCIGDDCEWEHVCPYGNLKTSLFTFFFTAPSSKTYIHTYMLHLISLSSHIILQAKSGVLMQYTLVWKHLNMRTC